MAIDAYLVFDKGNTVSVKGEATRKGFENAIEIDDWSFDVENTVSIGSAATGAGAGKLTFNPFTITKRPDVSSPMLFQNCAAGSHFEKVTFEYGSLEIRYTPQKTDGTSGSPVVSGWNRVRNAKSPT